MNETKLHNDPLDTASKAAKRHRFQHGVVQVAPGDQGSVHQGRMTHVLERQQELQMVDSHGGRVAWRIFGHGRPLVLLHGGHGTWRHWIRNIQALAEQRMVCVPDMPGYGDSDPTDESTMKALLERLESSLTILLGAGTRIDLGGFSFGGLMAAHLAASRGDVDRLALLGVVGHGGIRRPKAELLDWRVHAQMGDTQALQQAMRHNLLAHMLHAEASVDEQALQIHTDACLRTRFRSKPISRSGGLQALLSRTAPSLLLVWGEHDVTADPASLAPALAAFHAHCITTTLPDAGHWVQYESAAAINMLLSKWLAAPHLD